MTRKLFGTDGVRGVAGEFLTAELALALGRAATRNTGAERPQVLIVRDTRESGEMLQAALAAGVSAAGGDALLGGVLPTPAAPLLIRRYGFDLAVVISASHNPYQDNGIKFFAGGRLQALRRVRAGDRAGARRCGPRGCRRPVAIGRIRELRGAPEDYLRELHVRFRELDLDGLDVLLDCANGATYPGGAGDLQAPGREGVGDRGCARRAQHQRRLRLHARARAGRAGASRAPTRSASRSTATATACWRWTVAATSSTATS